MIPDAAWRCDRRKLWIPILVTGLVAGACERPLSVERVPEPRPSRSVTGEPIRDQVMGPLSDLARHVVAGLQDPAARGNLVRAMKEPDMRGRGVDLLDCDEATAFGAVLASAERRGGRGRGLLCASIHKSGGLILYMDPDRLAGWDSTVIPIVTAVAEPNRPMPNTFLGYRSPSQTIDIPRDGSLGGPILVILPYLHHKRLTSRPASLLRSEVTRVATPAQQSISPARRPNQ